ncbi:hypothetical protein IAE51_10920 [Lactococcus sp. S64]|uniref:hypothetical protein n=1 Tax=Lactococcus sp. S64 TaxID=2767459 RepID=UPI001905726F|nr:hypothetical protein [Lactococcus sp. S64]MBK0084406.1 hypothetical protein [Lactococcus sp. S64]
MKKRKMLILALLVVVLVGVGIIGGKYYMNEKAEKEKVELQTSDYSIEQERILAKQIKNTFADIKSVKFVNKSMSKNSVAGFISIDIIIQTDNKNEKIGTDFPINKDNESKSEQLESYIGGDDLNNGETSNNITVYFTNDSEEVL